MDALDYILEQRYLTSSPFHPRPSVEHLPKQEIILQSKQGDALSFIPYYQSSKYKIITASCFHNSQPLIAVYNGIFSRVVNIASNQYITAFEESRVEAMFTFENYLIIVSNLMNLKIFLLPQYQLQYQISFTKIDVDAVFLLTKPGIYDIIAQTKQ